MPAIDRVRSFDGDIYQCGEAGYEEARCSAIWNGRKPNRFPEFIIQATSDRDVVNAVRLARQRGMKLGIRSGGHSWAASFLQDGGILLDLSQLREASIKSEARTAVIQPGLTGMDLNQQLREHDLFFPTGHCATVGLGGSLLQGGFGWNSRLWGPACLSVSAIDVVTAAGELIQASETQNSDLFWAARGSGPGFFGAVMRFHLKLFELPRIMMMSVYLYPFSVFDEVLRWLIDTGPTLPKNIDPMVMIGHDLDGSDKPGILVIGAVFADNEQEAVAALDVMETCPVLDQAITHVPKVRTTLDEMLQRNDRFHPPGTHFAVDNMWTNRRADDLLPGLRKIAMSLPVAPSHVFIAPWGEQVLPDMAFSLQAETYIGVYAIGQNQEKESEYQAWVTDHMRELEPLSIGIQLADENLGARPFSFVAEENMRRIEALRAKYDPQRLFHSYMGMVPQI